MYRFEFVNKEQRAPIKNSLIVIITEVQDILRDEFTFRFDFDVNIEINDDECNFTAKEIKTKLISAFNKVTPTYGYD